MPQGVRVRISPGAPKVKVMKKNVFGLFSIPIMIIEEFISDNERLELINQIKKLEFGKHDAVTEGSTSTHFNGTTNLLHSIDTEKFDNLLERINTQLNYFAEMYGLNTLELTNSWVNRQTIGSKLKTHSHPDSKISGVLYLQTDDKSSQLYFYNPNPYNKIQNFNVTTEFNWSWYSLKPINCQLILFPSWLEHGSNDDQNQTDERIALSFNSNFRRI